MKITPAMLAALDVLVEGPARESNTTALARRPWPEETGRVYWQTWRRLIHDGLAETFTERGIELLRITELGRSWRNSERQRRGIAAGGNPGRPE